MLWGMYRQKRWRETNSIKSIKQGFTKISLAFEVPANKAPEKSWTFKRRLKGQSAGVSRAHYERGLEI